ncbi:hypothetical protein LJC61_08145, partial [Ruminococcaceae bacterium OttesenSCG-928-A16]|nr:hypothetical protein [Ruminococcaceae bacterium OttesenSCG-928-A16]
MHPLERLNAIEARLNAVIVQEKSVLLECENLKNDITALKQQYIAPPPVAAPPVQPLPYTVPAPGMQQPAQPPYPAQPVAQQPAQPPYPAQPVAQQPAQPPYPAQQAARPAYAAQPVAQQPAVYQ